MSWIQSVQIKDFRGIAKCSVDKLGRVNLLIGKNNAGKSTLLEAMTRPFDVGKGTTLDVRGRPVREIWARSRGEHANFPVELVRGGADKLDLQVVADVASPHWIAQPAGDTVAWSVPGGGVGPRLGFFLPLDWMDQAVEAQLWPLLLRTRQDRELAEIVTELFGEKVDSLQMLQSGDLVIGLERFGIRLDSQGSGFRSALRLLMVAAATAGGVLVVEEPECHQHASSLKRLARALTKQAQSRDIQLFISTHSLECVKAFAECAEPTPRDDAGWPFLTLSLERQPNGIVAVRRLSKETVLGLDAAGTDVRFLDEYQ